VISFIFAVGYTMCLLLIQCLERGTSRSYLQWVNKLRPFFDAYTGPCKDHYRFWPGLLLFIRLGLYITLFVIKLNSDFHTGYLVMGICILLVFLACIFPKGVYKKWPLNVIEACYLINLGIASGVVAERSNPVVGVLSVSVAAVIFILILVYHCYSRLYGVGLCQGIRRRMREAYGRRFRTVSLGDAELSSEISPLIHQGLPRYRSFTEPREPLLECS